MAYGLPLSLTNYFFYIIYMASLSCFALKNKMIEKDKMTEMNTTYLTNEPNYANHENYFLCIIILAYSFINIVCEIVQLIQQVGIV
uniref:Uncharacterized protein n=1 Tax=Octopus bimaculoides TaxID=37653 RepID=A0A0L8IH84_OCTBM